MRTASNYGKRSGNKASACCIGCAPGSLHLTGSRGLFFKNSKENIMFTTEHLIWIGICAAFVLIMNLICHRLNRSLRVVSRIMAAVCIVSESSKIMSSMLENQSGGRYLDPLALPFHLCSLMLFGVLFIAFGKDGTPKRSTSNVIPVVANQVFLISPLYFFNLFIFSSFSFWLRCSRTSQLLPQVRNMCRGSTRSGPLFPDETVPFHPSTSRPH